MSRAAQASVGQAEALKKAAELELKFQIDIAKGGGFRSEKDQAEVKLLAAKAGVKAAQVRLEGSKIQWQKVKDALGRTEIKVPVQTSEFSHKVTARKYLILDRQVQLGQFVGPERPPMFLLTPDLEHMEIPLSVTITGTVIGLVLSACCPWPWPSDFMNPQQRGRVAGLVPMLGWQPWPFWRPDRLPAAAES